MSTIDKLEALFNGERDDVSLEEISDIISLMPLGEIRLKGIVTVTPDLELDIDFVKREGRWFVTGYNRVPAS